MAIHLKSQHVTNMYTPIELVTTGIGNVHIGGGGGYTDHGYLHGLADNDHPQYLLSSATTNYITGGGGLSDYLGTGATVSFVHTSNSSEFIAVSNSGAFAISDHSHSDLLTGVSTDYAGISHSHGDIFTATVDGVDMLFNSASDGLNIYIPSFVTTFSGVYPFAALGSGGGMIERWNGALSFMNSNGVSFGLNDDGNVVTASVAGIGGAQTGISGIYDGAGSGLTEGSLSFTNMNGVSFIMTGSKMQGSFSTLSFEDSNNIEFGISAGTLTASATPVNIAIEGNTTGSGTAYINSGTAVLYGGSNITLEQDGASIIFNAPSGGKIISVNAAGNTLGTIASITNDTVYFAGGNNITLSQDSNSISIIGPAQGGVQTAISGIAANGSTFTSGTVYVSAQSNITVNSYANGASQYIQLSVGNYLTTAANSTHTHGSFSTASTAGEAIKFTSGSGGVTVGVPAYLTTAPSVSYTSVIAGTGYTSLSTTGSDILGTHDTAGLKLGIPKYLTTAPSFTHTHGSASMNLSNLTGNISSLSDGITVNLTGFEAGDFVLTANIGTVYFGGGSNITWSSTASSNSTTIMATAGGGSGGGMAMTLSGNTSGTMTIMSSGTIRLVGGNNITLSQAGNIVTILGGGGGANSGFTTSATAGSNVAGTLNSNGLNLAVPAYLTTAMQSNLTTRFAGVNISTLTVTGSLAQVTMNTSGLTLGMPKFITTSPVASIYFSDRNGHSWGSSVNGVSTSIYIIT
jgi:hypothetical protein